MIIESSSFVRQILFYTHLNCRFRFRRRRQKKKNNWRWLKTPTSHSLCDLLSLQAFFSINDDCIPISIHHLPFLRNNKIIAFHMRKCFHNFVYDQRWDNSLTLLWWNVTRPSIATQPYRMPFMLQKYTLSWLWAPAQWVLSEW